MPQKLKTLADRSPIVSGRFYSSSADKLKMEMREYFSIAAKHETAELAKDEDIAAKLWEVSEKLTNTKFTLKDQ